MKSMRITILGCGSSGGVPRVAQGWGNCDPNEPKNRRRRCSVLIEKLGENGVTRILIDTSPDLRAQLLDAELDSLDAVVFTHEHADHTHGIDDLRPIFLHMKSCRIPVHADEATLKVLKARFGYCFSTPYGSEYPPILEDRLIELDQEIKINGLGGEICLQPFPLIHGNIEALGFRCGNLAYTPDVNSIPGNSLKYLKNLDFWIIDALRYKPHPSHFTLDDALGWIRIMQPKQAILTNLHIDLDYKQLCNDLPADIKPAYDGMRIEF